MFSGGKLTITMAPTGECVSQQWGNEPAAECSDAMVRFKEELSTACVGADGSDQCAGITSGVSDDLQSMTYVFDDGFQCGQLPEATQSRFPAIFGTPDGLQACQSLVDGFDFTQPVANPEVPVENPEVPAEGGGLHIPVTIIDNGVVQNEGDEQVDEADEGTEANEEPAEGEGEDDGNEGGISTLMLSIGLGYVHAWADGLYDPFPTSGLSGGLDGDFPNAGGTGDFPNAGGSNADGYGADASNGMSIDATLKYFPLNMGAFGVYISAGAEFGWQPAPEISNTSLLDPYVSNKTNPSDFFFAGGRIGAGARLDVGFALDLGIGVHLGWLGLGSGGPGFPTDIDTYIDYSEFSYGPYLRLALGYSWFTGFIEYKYDGGHQHGFVDPSLGVEGREISPDRHTFGAGISVDIPLL